MTSDLVAASPYRSLSQLIQTDRILSVERVIELSIALLRARLDSPDIHGQITPDRVLLISEQPVRVEILPADELRADPEFSAPEILDGKSSHSSDIYSIGLIAIYLLTGTRPFQVFDTANRCWVWQDYWRSDRQSARINTHQLVTILNRAIDLNSDLRFSSAREMMLAIFEFYPQISIPPHHWDCDRVLVGHCGLFAAIKAIAISPHLPIVATGSEDTTIRLWNIHTGVEIGILTGHQKPVETISFHPDRSGLLFSSDRAGIIKLWQVKTHLELSSVDSQQGKVNSLAISPDGKLLISGSSDRTIKIWQLDLTQYRGSGAEIQISITLLSHISLTLITTLKTHKLSVNQVAFNPIASEVKFASVSSDGQLMLWGLESQTPLNILAAHTQAVKALAFSPDGKLLATAGDDGLILIWDIDNRKLAQTLSAHRWTISALAFLKDGHTLISASWDGNIKFWQVDTGQEIDCLPTHTAEVLALGIGNSSSPQTIRDRQYIITASRDRTAKIWHQI
jgi:WD40 repeat protein